MTGGWNAGAWHDSAPRPSAVRRARQRELFLAAALELFGRDGYALTSIERLCATAGATPRDFYAEFASREELLIAVHDRLTTEAMNALVDALEAYEPASLPRRIEAGIRAYLSVALADPYRSRVAYVEVVGVSPAVERHRQAWRERFIQLFTAQTERAAERGEITERDYRLAAIAVVGTLNEMAYQWVLRPATRPPDDVVQELVRLIVAALTVAC